MRHSLSILMVFFFLAAASVPVVESCPGEKCDPAKCAEMHKEGTHLHKCPGAKAAEAAAADNLVVDPVCGMTIDKGEAAAQVEYKGQTYYFCRLEGKETFLSDPAKYVGQQ